MILMTHDKMELSITMFDALYPVYSVLFDFFTIYKNYIDCGDILIY